MAALQWRQPSLEYTRTLLKSIERFARGAEFFVCMKTLAAHVLDSVADPTTPFQLYLVAFRLLSGHTDDVPAQEGV